MILSPSWWNGRHSGLKIRWRVTSVWVRIPLSAPISSMSTKQTSVPTYPASAGVYRYRSPGMHTHVVVVEETSAAGRLCKELKMGGSAHCGLKPWDGLWYHLSQDEVKKYIKNTLASAFGLDSYGYGTTEEGVVVYHYNKLTKQSKSKFPESMYGVIITHEYMGNIKPL